MGRLMGYFVACWLLSALTLAQEDGGQPLRLSIEVPGTQYFSSDGRQIIEGLVRIHYPGVFLMTADGCEYDRQNGHLLARGNIKIDFETKLGLVEVTAREMNYYLAERSGDFLEVTAQFGDEFFFAGERLEVLEEGTVFLIERGSLTACNQPLAQWALKVKHARIEREGYAILKGARFRIKKLDLIYLPYLILPVMQERRSGLLRPDTGNSDRNGSFFSQPVYWAPRQDFDMTITPTYYDKAGARLDAEMRYHPSPGLKGVFDGRYFSDRIIGRTERTGNTPLEDGKPLSEDRYRLSVKHDQVLFGGNFEARAEAGSDFSVDRDFLQDAQKTRLRDYYYRLRFDKRLGRDLLTLRISDLDRILAQNEEVTGVGRLPEIQFFQPNRRIAGGFYFRNRVYLNGFDLDGLGATRFDGQVWRLGMDSEVSRTFDFSRFLHTRWGFAYRGAHYTPDGESPSATLGGLFGFLETVGPRLQRTYQVGKRRLIHFADLGLAIRAGHNEEDPFLETIRLDELDIRLKDQREDLQMSWRLNSRHFWGGRLVRPLLEVEIRQDVDFENEGENEQNAPVETRFRLNQWKGVHANGLFEYNPDLGALDTLAVYGSVNRGKWRGYGGYVKRRQTDAQSAQESFIGISEFEIPTWRSRFKLSMDYDFEQADFKSQELLYAFQGQCMGVAFNYVKSPFDSRDLEEKDFFQIIFTLRNLSENLGTKF